MADEKLTGFHAFIFLIRRNGLCYALKHALSLLFTYPEYLRFLLKPVNQWDKRIRILKQYRMIHRLINCSHKEGELLRIADEILSLPDSLQGDIIELGVHKGGASCKLSIIAKLTGRKLVICDAFLGLPEPRKAEKKFYKKGEFAGGLNEVQDNITHFGETDYVEVISGWFHETLPTLRHRKFVVIFEDVDLYDSGRCCVENLWPTLQPGCKMFTHEAGLPGLTALRAYTNKYFWSSKLGHLPPPFISVGVGLRLSTPTLGYIQKPR